MAVAALNYAQTLSPDGKSCYDASVGSNGTPTIDRTQGQQASVESDDTLSRSGTLHFHATVEDEPEDKPITKHGPCLVCL